MQECHASNTDNNTDNDTGMQMNNDIQNSYIDFNLYTRIHIKGK